MNANDNQAAQDAAAHRLRWKRHWRRELPRLNQLDLPLLAVGAGNERKAPVNLNTGEALKGWQTARHSIHGIEFAAGIKRNICGCGTRTGAEAGGLVSFDLDGITAIERAMEHGCNPREAKTWQIHRNTDPNRLKVHWRLTPEQQQQWRDDRPKLHTRDAVKTTEGRVLEKGQALEVIHHSRQQVIVLGEHPSSKGYYYWPEGMGPEALAGIPDNWWQLALEVARSSKTSTSSNTTSRTSKATSRRGDWRSLNPCPICGRNTTGFCSIHADGRTLRCFKGETFRPPTGLIAGDEISDNQGKVWAFSKEKTQDDGNVFSVFVEPIPERTRERQEAEWQIILDGFDVHEGTVGIPNRRSEPSRPKELTFEDRWSLLEARADEIAATSWSTMKATAALAAAASDLELSRLGTRQLEQLLEAAQRRRRATAKPINGGGVFTVQATPWAVEGLFRHGLNLLVGQPGAGKTRLAAACIAAWLRGAQSWLNLPMPCTLPIEQRHALIIGTDQPLEDWAVTLEPVGLVERISPTEVRLHPRLTLYQLEVGAQLDADTLAGIRRWSDQHPGCPVIADSLAALLPPGIDEDKAAAAKPVYGLQEAISTGWAILTHHTRKAAGKEGNIGVGAGRGSSSIDGAVSRVIGLGLIHKMENGVMTPQESDPRRELLSMKRGGATLHLVVRSDGNGDWSNEGTAEDLKRQERKERTLANLTDSQSAVMAVLEDAGTWLTGRQVAEGLLEPGEEYDNRGSKAAATRKVLKRLEVLGVVETKRVGRESLYRPANPAAIEHTGQGQSNTHEVDKTGSNGSNAAAQGISPALPVALTGSRRLSPRVQVEPPPASRATAEPQVEPPKPLATQGESQESHPTPLPVTVEGQHGWVLPGGRIPKAGNVLAVGPDGQSHHVAVIGVKPALTPPRAPAPDPAAATDGDDFDEFEALEVPEVPSYAERMAAQERQQQAAA